MRITVDIDESTLKDVIALTGESRKSPALAKAVDEFVRRRKASAFGKMIREGVFDYPHMSPEEDRNLNPLPPGD